MLIKILWCLIAKNDSFIQKNIEDKKSQISLCFANTRFLKTFLPKFFDFKEPLIHEKFIIHCKRIIDNVTQKNFDKNSIQEYYLNKEKIKNKVDCSILNLQYLKSKFSLNLNLINYFQRIELLIFEFVFQKIKAIEVLDNDNTFCNKILKHDIYFIMRLLKKLSRLNNLLKTKIESGTFISIKSIKVIKELSDHLNNIKNDKKQKLYFSQLLNEMFVEYINEYVNKIKSIKNEITTENFLSTIIARIEFANLKLNELNDCLKEKIVLKTKHFGLEIQNKILKVNNVVLMIFKSDCSILKVDTLIEIYLYFNYIKIIIWLKQYKSENNLKLQIFFAKAFGFNKSEVIKILEFITLQQKMLINLVYKFCKKYRNYNPKYIFRKNEHSKFVSYIFFLDLERTNDDYNNLSFSKKYNRRDELNIIGLCNSLSTNIKCYNFSNIESSNNNFNFIKTQCFFLLKLCSLYLCNQNLYLNVFKDSFFQIICEIIFKLNSCLNNKKVLGYNMDMKINFFRIILENLKETKKILNATSKYSTNISEHTKLTKFQIPISKLYVYLYESANHSSVRDLQFFYQNEDVCNKKSFLDTNNLKVKNINLYHKQYTGKKCNKPKKFWQKRWEAFETNTINTNN
ncbi:hypothetical protein NUSPORA_01864 [Nucleospora cyclopteri]